MPRAASKAVFDHLGHTFRQASRREAVKRYGVIASVVVHWAQRFEKTGSVAAQPSGGSTLIPGGTASSPQGSRCGGGVRAAGAMLFCLRGIRPSSTSSSRRSVKRGLIVNTKSRGALSCQYPL